MKRACLALLLLLCGAWLPAQGQAQAGLQAPETRVKAAFLFKFGDYVEWPPGRFDSAASPLRICVLDAEELGNELSALVAGRSVSGRPVQVRGLRRGDAMQDCHVVFVGGRGNAELAQALAPLRGQPTLVVTEASDGLRADSVINFVVLADKVRFDVSLASAESRRLHISSRLLSVARKVVPAP